MKKTYKHKKFTATFTDESGYFSFTGNFDGGMGAVGDKIAEVDERFAPLNAIHLSNSETGAPMHAVSNGLHWAKEGKSAVLAKHLRIDFDAAVQTVKDVAYAGIVGDREGIKKQVEWELHTKTLLSALDDCTGSGQTIYDAFDKLKALNSKVNADAKITLTPHLMAHPTVEGLKELTGELREELKLSYQMAKRFPDEQIAAEHLEVMQKVIVPLRIQWQAEADNVRDLAEDIESNLTEGYTNPIEEETGEWISEEYETELDDLEVDKVSKMMALAKMEDVDVLDIEGSEYDCNSFEVGGSEYLVVTDDEADTPWDEALDSYIDDCMEIPEAMENYFDREKWKRDAKIDGRAHSLNRYDGSEACERVTDKDGNEQVYYIYQQ